MDTYLNGKRIRLDPSRSVGKGGEADVYDIGNNVALKIWKQPDHPDLAGQPEEQRVARERIAEHQRKLRAFPHNLPARVIAPATLATDKNGLVVGYAMPLISNAEPLFRYGDRGFVEAGITRDQVRNTLLDLHTTVESVHRANVVIGDFNDLNVLVRNTEAFLIDADSMQFGGFPCRLFTIKFLDPLLADPRASSPLLAKPHTADSDWYAYAIMLMQSLLYTGPYGGVYAPKNSRDRIAHDARALRRITVFHPEVRYPKPALPWNILPDDLLDRFHRTFEKDERGSFPARHIESLRWTVCTACGTTHSRPSCPSCKQAAPAAVKEKTVVRGTVTATRIFQTLGRILYATIQDKKLRWLYHENGAFRRENRTIVLSGALDPGIRYRISGDTTLFGKDGQIASVRPNESPKITATDSVGSLPIFDANGEHAYWLESGRLLRNGALGPERIGEALANQTLLWVGSEFGFGLYRAGGLSVAFVFDTERAGLNDSVKLPPLRGQLVDATCVFGPDRAWFFTTMQNSGALQNRCTVIRRDGSVEATAETPAGDGSWLGTIRGRCAAGGFLLAATDDGILRVEPDGNILRVTRTFPDTEPFADSSSFLHADSHGLYVVGRQEITRLRIT